MSIPVAEGTRLRGGDYVVESVLGTGGFGITYRATETMLERHVAVKEFFPAGCERDGLCLTTAGYWTPDLLAECAASFLQEGRTLARLSHSSIVPIYSIFEENRSVYLVMEFIEGQTLRDYMASQNGRLPVEEALGFARQAGEALSVVHSHGLLHRDLKPANLMLRPDGRLMLIDFGSAREITETPQRYTSTRTHGYAPIEQYQEYGTLGPETDVYGLAAVLYHMLTGSIPVNALSRHNGMELPSPSAIVPAVSHGISAAVMLGLAADRARRPVSARAFLSRLAVAAAEAEVEQPCSLDESSYEATPMMGRSSYVLPAAPASIISPPSGAMPFDFSTPASPSPTCERVLSGHEKAVYSVAWSPDGRRLVSAGRDTTLRIWNPASGAQTAVLEGHAAAVSSAAWSPDGRQIGSGSWYVGVLVWDAETGQVERTLSGHTKSVAAVGWGPYARLLASGSADRTARIWDAAGGETLAVLKGHVDRVTCVAWNPHGNTLATGSDDRTVRIWDGAGGEEIRALRGGMKAVASVAWSPDGRWLAASGTTAGTVWIWDVAAARLERTIQVNPREVLLAAYSAAWRPDGALLAFGCQNGTVQIWDPHTGQPVHTLRDHQGTVHSVAWSPDGSQLASGGEDGSVRVWDAGEKMRG